MSIKNLTRKKKISIVIVLVFLIPFPSEIVPEWELKVVDKDGTPLNNRQITQEWYFSSALEEYTEIKSTDKNGIVVFSSRTFICPLICKIPLWGIDSLNSILLHGAPTFGSARVQDNESGNSIRFHNGDNIENKLVVK